MLSPDQNGNGAPAAKAPDDSAPDVIALQALGWIVSEEARARRLLDLTGLDADQLRARAADPALWRAAFEFLAAHEPDLLACADALGLPPERLVQAGREIGQEAGR